MVLEHRRHTLHVHDLEICGVFFERFAVSFVREVNGEVDNRSRLVSFVPHGDLPREEARTRAIVNGIFEVLRLVLAFRIRVVRKVRHIHRPSERGVPRYGT